jgi:hypothetical protein
MTTGTSNILAIVSHLWAMDILRLSWTPPVTWATILDSKMTAHTPAGR